MHRGAATLLSISVLGSFACTVASTDDSLTAGSSGVDPAGMGGAPGGGGCASTGSGTVEVQITGLPGGVPAALTLTGPGGAQTLTSATTLAALGAGPYSVTAARVADTDPIVRTLYDETLSETAFCLTSGGTHQVQLSYAAIPTSHHLWTNNSNGSGNLLGFSGSILNASASAEPGVAVSAGAGKDVTFDADGNLWSMGSTVADPHLMRFPRAVLGASGNKQPDRGIDIAGVACLPAMRAFAFDAHGALWVSSCGGRVSRLNETELAATGEVTPSVNLGGLTDNGDLAFDAAGNLWITDGEAVLRFDAARLGASSEAPAELTLRVRNSADSVDLVPSNLVFDASGNLWVSDFGGNLLSRVARASLSGSGAQSAVSEVTIALAVSALLERPAFDESGGLWLALNQNRFGRLAPSQLSLSSSAGDPTTPETLITSSSMGYANRMAFFPAAAALPLYHRFP